MELWIVSRREDILRRMVIKSLFGRRLWQKREFQGNWGEDDCMVTKKREEGACFELMECAGGKNQRPRGEKKTRACLTGKTAYVPLVVEKGEEGKEQEEHLAGGLPDLGYKKC